MEFEVHKIRTLLSLSTPLSLTLLLTTAFTLRPRCCPICRHHRAVAIRHSPTAVVTPETIASLPPMPLPARRSAASPLSLLRSTPISLVTKRQARRPDSFSVAVRGPARSRRYSRLLLHTPTSLSQICHLHPHLSLAPSLSFSLGGAAALLFMTVQRRRCRPLFLSFFSPSTIKSPSPFLRSQRRCCHSFTPSLPRVILRNSCCCCPHCSAHRSRSVLHHAVVLAVRTCVTFFSIHIEPLIPLYSLFNSTIAASNQQRSLLAYPSQIRRSLAVRCCCCCVETSPSPQPGSPPLHSRH